MNELLELVDLPNPLFQWSLDIATGEIYPGPDESAHLKPLPRLTETQILDWMSSFLLQTTEMRIQGPLTAALRHSAPMLRFREILSVNPQALKEWDYFFNLKRREILEDWINSLGLEPGSESQ